MTNDEGRMYKKFYHEEIYPQIAEITQIFDPDKSG